MDLIIGCFLGMDLGWDEGVREREMVFEGMMLVMYSVFSRLVDCNVLLCEG